MSSNLALIIEDLPTTKVTERVEDVLPQSALRRLKRDGLFGLGEEYIEGNWESSSLSEFLYEIVSRRKDLLPRLSFNVLLNAFRERLLNPQRGHGVFTVARKHYDLGNDLFTAMLDSSMTYTCGLWEEGFTLDQAQQRKLKIICDKLELQRGMRVLDIGCGWGNFAHFASEHYGVVVDGVTVSVEQAQFAKERCSGLPVKILVKDYREVVGEYDRIVSIEMIEAVGRKNIPTFFDTAYRCLKRDGLFLVQAISGETFTRYSDRALDQFVVFLLKHIFPNGYLPTIADITTPCRGKFVLEEIRSYPGNYERTLAAWEDNFIRGWPNLRSSYGEEFCRTWRYYLSGCQAMFRGGLANLYQILLRKIQ